MEKVREVQKLSVVLTIDLGLLGSTRTIASGLRAFYKAEEVQGRKVMVLANLKERPMAGFKSQVGLTLQGTSYG